MATCKDCIHDGVCHIQEMSMGLEMEEYLKEFGCEDFKNKADFVKIKHGYWVFTRAEWGSSDYYQDAYYKCSNCNKEYVEFSIDEANYCPNCAAINEWR